MARSISDMRELTKKLKRSLLVLFWIFILFALSFGLNRILFFLPNDFLSLKNARLSLSMGISSLLLIYLGLKYEKMQDEIYKWKNKDKIINQFNEHIFKDDERE